MAIIGNINLTYTQVIELINTASTVNGWGITARAGTIGDKSIQFVDSNNNKFAVTCDEKGQSNYPGITVYYNNGSSYTNYYVNSDTNANVYDIYICSHGFILQSYASGYTTQRAHLIVTINDDGAIKTIFTSSNGAALTSCKCAAYSDNGYQSCAYTANLANSTSLTNFVSKGSIGVDSSCQYAFFMPLYQYNSVGILTGDGIDYITNGYWCIQD